jgi:hypothetical protein
VTDAEVQRRLLLNWDAAGAALIFERDDRPELQFDIPNEVFVAAHQHNIRVEATLFLTSFQLGLRKPLSSVAGASIDAFSECHLGDFLFGSAVTCVSTRPVATCTAVSSSKTGPRARDSNQPNIFACGRSYDLWPLPFWRDAYYASSLLAEPTMIGIAQVTPASERAASADRGANTDQAIVSNYLPQAHFEREISFDLSAATPATSSEQHSVDGVGEAARFVDPVSMVADSHGNLFVVDEMDHVVRKISPLAEVTTFAGSAGQKGRADGRGPDARFNQPSGIAADTADNLYVTDAGNALIRKITPDGTVSTVAVSGVAGATPWRPQALVHGADGALYMIDRRGRHGPVIIKISPSGEASVVAGAPD